MNDCCRRMHGINNEHGETKAKNGERNPIEIFDEINKTRKSQR